MILQVQSKIQSSRALSLSQFLNGPENQTSSPVGSDFVLIPQPPRFLQHRFPLIVQFRCNQSAVIGVEVLVWGELQDAGVIVFRHRFNCSSQPKKVQHRTVRLKLPRYIAYRPGEWNQYSVVIDRAIIRTWILDVEKFELIKAFRTFYRNATVKDEISVGVVPAFERLKRPRLKCLPWWRNVTQPVYNPKCHADLGWGKFVIYKRDLSKLDRQSSIIIMFEISLIVWFSFPCFIVEVSNVLVFEPSTSHMSFRQPLYKIWQRDFKIICIDCRLWQTHFCPFCRHPGVVNSPGFKTNDVLC